MNTANEIIEKCSNRLKALAEFVTAEDRKSAESEFNVHYATVHRYLKGEVKNLDFGVRLYDFLNKRIQERNAVLNA